jgi:hypothetical protein
MSYHSFEGEGGKYGSFEVFYAFKGDRIEEDGTECEAGWYWWSCFPGCLPESGVFGPFESEKLAYEDAQSNA